MLFRAVFLMACLVSTQAFALSVVLVHGFLDDGSTWWRAGISQQLLTLPVKVYTPTLPAAAPLPVQAAALRAFLVNAGLAASQAPVVLVGHSAGGLVARLVLLENARLRENKLSIIALITIATPHASTDRAFWGARLLRSPLGVLPPFLGLGILHAATPLLFELGEARPGSLLFFINALLHPPLRYISIVRSNAIPFGDFLVPSASQDLRAVPGIAQWYPVETFVSGGGHFLEFSDGVILRGILVQWLLKSPALLYSP